MRTGPASFAIPILAVVLFAASLGWFLYGRLRHDAPTETTTPTTSAAGTARPPAGDTKAAAPGTEASISGAPGAVPAGNAGAAGSPSASPSSDGPSIAAGPAPAAVPGTALDVVRVEPGGDAVIAGRAPPGAKIELLVDGGSVAAATADVGGQFVFVPPALATGAHEVRLAASLPGGQPVRSDQAVTVVIAENLKDAPLVTVTTAGQPTVVLSRPAELAAASQAPPGQPAGIATPAAPVRIGSVERDASGRLLVTGTAAPSATVRLYVDDQLAGTAVAAADGRLAFAAAASAAPSSRVRLDAVDPTSGTVKTRGEVVFAPDLSASAGSAQPGSTQPGSTQAGQGQAGSGQPGATQLGTTQPGTTSVDAAAAGPARPRAPGAVAAAAKPAVPAPTGSDARPSPAPDPSGKVAALGPAARPGTTVADRGPQSRPEVAQPVRPRRHRLAAAGPRIRSLRVLPGQSLWQISQRIYGEGTRYTIIYGANSSQISDPDVIHPGQVFRVPAGSRRSDR